MFRHELSKSVSGRPLPVGTTPMNAHELSKRDHDVLYLEFFNSDATDRWVEIAYNAYAVKVKVPAEDSKKVGPIALAGRSDDGTEVSNKNVILKAEVANAIQVMGAVY